MATGVDVLIVIPSLNEAAHIENVIASLQADHGCRDALIAVSDGGSSDETVEVAKSVQSRAQIHKQENQGVVAARNRGIDMAKGKYICFVDSDDVVLPERFAKQVALLDGDNELGMVYADALIIDSKGGQIGKFSDVYPVVPGDVAQMLALHYCFTPMITVLVRTDVLRKTGPFEKPGPISDYMKWIEVAYISKVHYDPEPLGCWRRHQASTSKQANKVKSYAKTRAALKRILRKHPALNTEIGNKIVRRYSRSYFLTAFWLAADGNVRRARKYYYKAVKLYPLSFENWGGLILTCFPAGNLVAKLHSYVRAKKLPW